jgi:hypothetical protein
LLKKVTRKASGICFHILELFATFDRTKKVINETNKVPKKEIEKARAIMKLYFEQKNLK